MPSSSVPSQKSQSCFREESLSQSYLHAKVTPRNTMNAEHFDGIVNDQFLWDDNGGGYGDIADIYNMIREDANDQ